MNGQKFCLKWDHFRTSVTSVFNNLRQDEELVDITLCCEGQKIKAHRMMLSACSPYFRELLKENPCQHPVFFLKDTSIEDLRAVIEFVYRGEVNVSQTQLGSFIKTAEMLQIRGLSGEEDDVAPSPAAPERRPAPLYPADKRRRLSEPPAAKIKVEKVDLTEDEDCGSLEAALGRVASFEGAEPSPLAGLSADDSLGEAGPSVAPPGDRSLQAPRPFVCGVCGQTYSRRDTLSHHLHSHRGNTACGVCGRHFATTSSRNRHARQHHPMGDGYPRRDSLLHHLQIHRGNTRCPFCQRVFGTTSSRNRHMPDRPPLSALDSDGRLCCTLCGRSYRTRDSFRHHVETHAGKTDCPHCGQTFATASNPTPLQLSVLDRVGRLICTICGRSYLTRDSFRHHVETHAGKTNCPHCGQTFATRSSRNRHAASCLQQRVDPRAPRRRPKPSPAFGRQDRPLVCPRCGRSYASRDSLRHHLETHEGRTLCAHCGKRFATISSRNYHLRSVHGEATSGGQRAPRGTLGGPDSPGGRLGSDSGMEVVFTDPAISGHWRSPDGPATASFACSHCPATYSNRKSLVNHLACHGGKTGCNVCGKVFSTVSSKNRHMLVHRQPEESVREVLVPPGLPK
ncbi:zinc finger and BTB domain-containing protein 17-like [Pollicipes pollicipes]|uniref:zinc finger and BTB domain-containing protein 17-like n=1 Tax=Pollicipes pollicipes TaxID=41117 RepID=UPI001885536D|nr:zinc finger and BTB domain-containing protein 17-like [Pollicipes pollicipes]